MNSDFVELLLLFKRFGVRYLLVGGYAVMYYCEPRYTKDIDLFVDRTPENLAGFAKAVEAFGFPMTAEQLKQFGQPNAMIAIGIPPGRIDFLSSITGLDFADSWAHSAEVDIGSTKVQIISRNDLIASKKAAGRPQDLLDLQNLEKHGDS